MQNEHFYFAFNFLCFFDLHFKKANKQKNKRINITAQQGGQVEERCGEQKQIERERKKEKWNLSMTNTDGDRVRQTWEQDKKKKNTACWDLQMR